MEVKETSFKADILGKRSHLAKVSSNASYYNQQISSRYKETSDGNSMDRCCDGGVVEKCESQMDCWEINIWNAIACKSTSQ